jgi:thiol peroxidase
MAVISLRGQATQTYSEPPTIGHTAPEFSLLDQKLQARSLADFAGLNKLIYTVPSLDTPVCAKTTRQLVEQLNDAGRQDNTAVILISADLPFAQQRYCKQYKLDITTLSLHRDTAFGRDYGLLIEDGPLTGLLARALLVLDRSNIVRHAELVADIGNEPDYTAALQVLADLGDTATA